MNRLYSWFSGKQQAKPTEVKHDFLRYFDSGLIAILFKYSNDTITDIQQAHPHLNGPLKHQWSSMDIKIVKTCILINASKCFDDASHEGPAPPAHCDPKQRFVMANERAFNQYHITALILAFIKVMLDDAPTATSGTLGKCLADSQVNWCITSRSINTQKVIKCFDWETDALCEFADGIVALLKNSAIEIMNNLFNAHAELPSPVPSQYPALGRQLRQAAPSCLVRTIDTLSEQKADVFHFPTHVRSKVALDQPISQTIAGLADCFACNTAIKYQEPPNFTCQSCLDRYPTLLFPTDDNEVPCPMLQFINHQVMTGPTQIVCQSPEQAVQISKQFPPQLGAKITHPMDPRYPEFMMQASRAFCANQNISSPNGQTVVQFPRPCMVYWGQPSHFYQYREPTQAHHVYNPAERPCYIFTGMDNQNTRNMHFNHVSNIHRHYEWSQQSAIPDGPGMLSPGRRGG
jgi:hypothetical protein